MQPEVEVALRSADLLGEGPVWRAQTQELLRVDIAQGLLHAWHPQSGRITTRRMDGEAAAAVPCRSGALVIAVDHDLYLVEDEREPRLIAGTEHDRPGNRFNDCRCDPQGRLWAGTMSKTRQPDAAALYRLDLQRGELETMIDGTTISNGIGWSPDGQLMYFIDSTTQRVDVFDFDGRDGSISGRRALAEIDPADGLPDGLAVDAEGGIWVCLFGGGAVRRYSSQGALEAHIALPVPHTTCPAFGGEDLSTLFITTTRHKLAEEDLPRYPAAGSVLALTPGVQGLPANQCEIGC
ncbi:MAG: SMP-30/gluconolactonase/LRE family protein [Solirubrobacteraceae bacterium]